MAITIKGSPEFIGITILSAGITKDKITLVTRAKYNLTWLGKEEVLKKGAVIMRLPTRTNIRNDASI